MTAEQITTILNRIASGERSAVDELIPIVYQQMKLIAVKQSAGEFRDAANPTELVHEAYIRLVGNEKLAWKSRSHFFGACASVIRRILVDQARARNAAKRGSGQAAIELHNEMAVTPKRLDLLELEEALVELQELAPRQVQLIELRYFAGLTEAEAAEILSLSRRTVSGDWAMAKAWLQTRLRN
ncbi:MAG TPA: RNA polymerase subunit sigma-70 [Planctomycetaceae bacterium]|nr:RNA polymerase subunit sigma-70 [Planctomycetaceae bacterium]